VACVSDLSATIRGAWPTIARRAPGDSDTARRDRLTCLLAISLALHLALLGWPTSWHAVIGPRTLATHGAQLSATLIPPAASASAVAAIVRREAPPLGLAPRRAAPPAASAPVADVASPARVLPAELASAPTPNLPIVPVVTPYYPAEQLTTRPRALAEPELDPQQLAAYIATGEIALTLWIDEHGTVAELYIENSDLPAVFAQTAAAAFRDVRFAPGEIDGHAVGSVLRIAVRYDDERLAGEHDMTRQSAGEPAT
jgi:hypothetical protein